MDLQTIDLGLYQENENYDERRYQDNLHSC